MNLESDSPCTTNTKVTAPATPLQHQEKPSGNSGSGSAQKR